MKTSHKVVIGDSRRMAEVPDESVHLIITSPPYWQLKDYGSDGQIGFNHSYEEYINNLNLTWNECRRVLQNGCRLCVNIGDQFARSVYYGRYKVIPIRTEIIKFCESAGFDYMGAIIWQKVTTCNTTGGASIMGSFPYPRNGILKLDYEFILIFKKYGKAPTVSKSTKELSRLTQAEWNQYFAGHWNFPGERQGRHLAMFPEELPKRLIKMFSFVGDTVLDPFLGSGTTSLAARNLCRNSIGYEINEKYLPLIRERLGIADGDAEKYEEARQPRLGVDFSSEIAGLPYIFKDPVAIDRKIDPKKLKFGSRIDDSDCERDTYYTVKEILSPEVLLLGNGVKIRLLGVRNRPASRNEAIQFLEEKVRGQKVYIRFDETKYDEDGCLSCYLYLKNKTFINAHYLRTGLVDVDAVAEYKYKTKFVAFANSPGTGHVHENKAYK